MEQKGKERVNSGLQRLCSPVEGSRRGKGRAGNEKTRKTEGWLTEGRRGGRAAKEGRRSKGESGKLF